MTTGLRDSPAHDLALQDTDFAGLARFARAHFGLNLPDSKKALVHSRLLPRLRANHLADFAAYLALLESNDGAKEREALVSALTTNVTNFFREVHHFDTLRDTVLPGLVETAKSGGRVRFWSAGCSSGQEPYSLAMTILDVFPEVANHDVRILATDIDPKIIAKARTGLFPATENTAIPDAMRNRWTKPGPTPRQFEMSEKAKALIAFAQLNLISSWPFDGCFDVIFCRNVAIYFDQETQQEVWQCLADRLHSGGLLFIGHSERLTGPVTDQFSAVGVTSFKKSSAQKNAG